MAERPLRSVRVEDALWQAASEVAAGRGESLSEAIRRFLRGYVKRAQSNG